MFHNGSEPGPRWLHEGQVHGSPHRDANTGRNSSGRSEERSNLLQHALADMVFLLRCFNERVSRLESRCGRGWVPLEDIDARLQRLEHAATIDGNDADLMPELQRRIAALEAAAAVAARSEPASMLPAVSRPQEALRQRDRGALRAEIARILQSAPASDGPAVLRALAASQPGRRLPAARTIRLHVQRLRTPQAAASRQHASNGTNRRMTR